MNSKKIFYILIAAIVIAVFLTVILIIRNIGGGGGGNVSLEFWGVFDNQQSFDRTIRDFESQNPGVRVNYRMVSYDTYESDLINALAAGTGPDIMMIHNTWLPKHGDKLISMPENIPGLNAPLMTIKGLKDQFVDVAFDDLTDGTSIFALPLYVDTLALYYNKDLFNSAGISRPPEDWDDFNSDVEKLTKLGPSGEITKSGAVMGTARNINRSTDILMALMLQSGVKMTDAENQSATFSRPVSNIAVGEIALKYYTDFANRSVRTYSWNDSQHYSIDAFAEGGTAMMINYSHQAAVLRSKNSRLNFGISPLPQVAKDDLKNYANYWAVAVSNKSPNPAKAWQFLAYLTSKEGISSYLNATLRPSARRDLIELQKDDVDLGPFAVQALSARSWYQIDNTAIESIFADMIDDVNFNRRTIREALRNAESRVDVLMSRQ